MKDAFIGVISFLVGVWLGRYWANWAFLNLLNKAFPFLKDK